MIQYHRDGSLRYILGSVTRLEEGPGIPPSIVSVNHDITERKQAEEALRKYAEEIYDLYNNAPCGYHSLAGDGLITQMNDTELRWLGYTREEVVGKRRISDFFTPESVTRFRRRSHNFWRRDRSTILNSIWYAGTAASFPCW
ncbi:MAG: PAS domain-containing protein [Chloroflexi bacterium]|nr:PAS domain-containing protein [Chloroflexota bacterium]